MNANIAQHVLLCVEDMYKSFYKRLRDKKAGLHNDEVQPPRYLNKDGFYQLVIQYIPERIASEHRFFVPYSLGFKKDNPKIEIKLPEILRGKDIKEIRIVPKYDARIFEVQYAYKVLKEDTPIICEDTKVLAIDLGASNFATCIDSDGNSFIIDGKKLKSYNQWYFKYNSYLEKIKAKQKFIGSTKRQVKIATKRNNQVRDYLGKAVKYIITYCKVNNIIVIIIGYTSDMAKIDASSKVNQLYNVLPFYQFKEMLKHSCEINGILFKEQEESYTSKASFFDNDDIPVYDPKNPKDYSFSGRRIFRGTYKTSTGVLVNADVNGALNIMKKSNVVPNAVLRLYNRGELNPPKRIRLHK